MKPERGEALGLRRDRVFVLHAGLSARSLIGMQSAAATTESAIAAVQTGR